MKVDTTVVTSLLDVMSGTVFISGTAEAPYSRRISESKSKYKKKKKINVAKRVYLRAPPLKQLTARVEDEAADAPPPLRSVTTISKTLPQKNGRVSRPILIADAIRDTQVRKILHDFDGRGVHEIQRAGIVGFLEVVFVG